MKASLEAYYGMSELEKERKSPSSWIIDLKVDLLGINAYICSHSILRISANYPDVYEIILFSNHTSQNHWGIKMALIRLSMA